MSERELRVAASLFTGNINGLGGIGIDSEYVSPLAISSTVKIEQKNKNPGKLASPHRPLRPDCDGREALGD